jgi:hypothetical protein
MTLHEMKTIGYVAGATGLAIAAIVVGLGLPRQATADAPGAPSAGPTDRSVDAAAGFPSASRDEAPPAPIFPDLTQTDPDLGLPGSGNSYCGPVAVSNSLMWLAQGGYPALAPPGQTLRERHLALVQQLSAHRYMATSPTMGTGAFGLIEGLERWIVDAGYEVARLEYQGWRGHPLENATRIKVPQRDWLAAALEAGGAAWLHVGWYRPPTRWEPAYQRHGGHWLTVVGSNDDGTLTLHDPAPYAGDEPAEERVSLRAIDQGWLLAGSDRLRADGHLVLEGGMHVKRDGEVAIVDGAVTLVLKPARASDD